MDDLILPLYRNGFISSEANFFFALIMGITFGFVLERTGFTRSKLISGTFYFTSLAVPKIMGTTVVTAATWFIIFSWLGWIDINQLFTPATYIWPYVVGGLMFGAGMVMAGYCPGTAVAGVGTGKTDALIFLVGVVAGMFVYFLIYPFISDFANSSNMGVLKLQDLFGGNQYTAYIITVALETSIILFMIFLRKMTQLGKTK